MVEQRRRQRELVLVARRAQPDPHCVERSEVGDVNLATGARTQRDEGDECRGIENDERAREEEARARERGGERGTTLNEAARLATKGSRVRGTRADADFQVLSLSTKLRWRCRCLGKSYATVW